MPQLTLAGVALLAGATLGGAALARSTRFPARWLHGAAGVVLSLLVLDLVAEIWSIAGLVAAVAGYALAAVLGSLSYGSAATAIGVHRFVEGAMLTLVISPAAIAGFAAHALAEGFAVGVSLLAAPRRTVVWWVAVACIAPVCGALVMSPVLQPIFTAMAAGAIARAAWRSVRAALARSGQPDPHSNTDAEGVRVEE
ncbi:zinc transporter ZupT [Hamadaea flava]|uniref:Uncharacterized protein n=1 Tax=Hamadaea flava TaxID=1742688 RepID=A0ABV8LMB9_9ACTN|nr:hypothetical protein [Hamadaea flava]MCP2323303.1 zinc transporter ZupT [Hamadaea flava]